MRMYKQTSKSVPSDWAKETDSRIHRRQIESNSQQNRLNSSSIKVTKVCAKQI